MENIIQIRKMRHEKILKNLEINKNSKILLKIVLHNARTCLEAKTASSCGWIGSRVDHKNNIDKLSFPLISLVKLKFAFTFKQICKKISHLFFERSPLPRIHFQVVKQIFSLRPNGNPRRFRRTNKSKVLISIPAPLVYEARWLSSLLCSQKLCVNHDSVNYLFTSWLIDLFNFLSTAAYQRVCLGLEPKRRGVLSVACCFVRFCSR